LIRDSNPTERMYTLCQSAGDILKKALKLTSSSSRIPSYAVVIGYDTSATLSSLQAGVSSAKDMSKLLSNVGFTVTTLLNEQATLANVGHNVVETNSCRYWQH
jgi:hypothetical protein